MAAVRNADADRFLAQRRPETFLYLIFGTDPGLVRERARQAARRAVDDPDDRMALLRLDADEALREPGRLSDEARAIGLFGGRRAIWIEVGARALLPALEPLIEDPPVDCTLILEAGNLKKGTPLRSLVERLPGGAAVECYPDDSGAIGRLIDEEARAAHLTVDPKARTALVDLLGADRMATRAELSKLMLYAQGDRVVTLDHVEAIVAEAAAPAADEAIDAAFLRKPERIEQPARRAFADGMDAGYFVGQALRHAAILHRVRLDIEAGRPRAEATAAHGRGGHFKQARRLEQQVGLWSAADLSRVIETLAEALPRIRREHRMAEMIAVRALWQTAKTGERR
jgi:DNA polymerase-3 subunit delta